MTVLPYGLSCAGVPRFDSAQQPGDYVCFVLGVGTGYMDDGIHVSTR